MATILVVDDDRLILKGVSLMLKSKGHTVFLAASGVEAMEAIIARWDDVDLIISDLNMPEVNGIELFLWITREFPDLVSKFMFHTSMPETLDGMEQQIREVRRIEKPSGRVDFLDIVTQALAPAATVPQQQDQLE